MRLRSVSTAWLLVSPRHRKFRLRGDRGEILALFLRLVSVGLLAAVAWVHLHLWQHGYRHIPTIGPLFLAGAMSAGLIGAGLLLRPSRLIGLLGVGLSVGILGGLIVSVNVGLFGFKESLSAPFTVESILLEMLATVTLGAWIAVDLVQESRCRRMDRPGVGPGLSPPTSRPTRRLTNCYPLAKDRDLNAI
jgi:hypothetical protein